MRKLIFFMHSSLDGYVAGTNGEMNWIKHDEALFDFVGTMTEKADTALYGKNTFQMMEGYWPTAADQPNASKHDKEHAAWYKAVHKIVLSTSLNESQFKNTKVISKNIAEEITAIKEAPGKNILIFGSPAASHSLLDLGLIDEFWIFMNPILLGKGMPLFKNIHTQINLRLVESKTFACGVIALHYEKI